MKIIRKLFTPKSLLVCGILTLILDPVCTGVGMWYSDYVENEFYIVVSQMISALLMMLGLILIWVPRAKGPLFKNDLGFAGGALFMLLVAFIFDNSLVLNPRPSEHWMLFSQRFIAYAAQVGMTWVLNYAYFINARLRSRFPSLSSWAGPLKDNHAMPS